LKESFAHFRSESFFILESMLIFVRGLNFFKSVISLSVNIKFSSEPGVIFDDNFHLSDLVDFAVVKVEFFEVWINKFFLLMEVGFRGLE
jgi:hypothetical protein